MLEATHVGLSVMVCQGNENMLILCLQLMQWGQEGRHCSDYLLVGYLTVLLTCAKQEPRMFCLFRSFIWTGLNRDSLFLCVWC